jgi:hypothetical protein
MRGPSHSHGHALPRQYSAGILKRWECIPFVINHDIDEYKPVWPSGLWVTSQGDETSKYTTAHNPS